MSQTDRHAFLHEGVGNRSTVAKVEIVFDNTDRRIPSDNSEVRIMRQVGQKKDEYFIDLKAASRTDVWFLLLLFCHDLFKGYVLGCKHDGVCGILSFKPLLHCQTGKDYGTGNRLRSISIKAHKRGYIFFFRP